MAPRLKVFEWSDGFHRFTVATSSRPKALEAWGIQQDIFASGLAREAPEAEDGEAARARPETVIERGLTVDVGLAGLLRPKKARRGPTLAQKRRVDQLVGQIKDLEQSHAEASGLLEEEVQALRVQREEAQQNFRETRDRLARELEAARGRS